MPPRCTSCRRHRSAHRRCERAHGTCAPRLAPEAEGFHLNHPWPGNVRRLEAVILHAVALTPGATIERNLLEELAPVKVKGATPREPETWEEFSARQNEDRRAWLQGMVDRHGGITEVAARAIACPSSTLRRVLRRNGNGHGP